MNTQTTQTDLPERPKLGIGAHALVLVIISVIGLVGNTVATGTAIADGFIGLIVLYVISMIGVALTLLVPVKLPSVAWISLVGILLTLPWTPGSEWIIAQAKNVNFLTLATPCLAYAGIAIAQQEIDIAKTSGWKILIIAILVMTGTYLGSAVIADIFL